MGRIQECVFESLAKMKRVTNHITMKKRTRSPMVQPGAYVELQRYCQLLPYGAERK
jgi:hypothetical protein